MPYSGEFFIYLLYANILMNDINYSASGRLASFSR
jgi:hypothetical protein